MWQSTNSKFVVCVIALVVCVLCSTTSHAQPPPRLDVSGFSWAENLAFDNSGNLFVSDAVTGTVWRIFPSPNTTNPYIKQKHLQFDRALGLALSQDGKTMYCVVKQNDQQLIVGFSPLVANQYRVVAELPTSGNGLGIDWKTNRLFATTEGLFLPRNGRVYQIEIDTGAVSDYIRSVTAPNGCFVDQERGLLYVGLVQPAKILIYDLKTNLYVRTYDLKGFKALDDFGLSPDGKSLVVADFLNGSISRVDVDWTKPPVTQVWGLQSPTSARWGVAPNFNPAHFYVSEGGSVTPFFKNRRVLEFTPS